MTAPRHQRKHDRLCSLKGCGLKHSARGWCKKHHYRWLRYGDPIGGSTGRGEPLAWLKALVASPPLTCAIWPFASGSDGYGRIRPGGRKGPFLRAHRLSLELFTGEPRPDMFAIHGPCHRRDCVNPHHLKWASFAENSDDKRRDGTHGKKLTEGQVSAIRKSDATANDLAEALSVSAATIRHIRSGATWR